MIIAHISDTHLAFDTADAARRLRDFASTIADINVLDPPADVIVHTGDIVHNGRQDEYAEAAALLAKARAPVYVLPGNKDDRANLRAVFSARGYLAPDSEFIDYAIEDYPVRLIALDTLSPGNGRGDFRPEQARRLIEMMDADLNKPIAVFTHHPPFEVTVGPDRCHFETIDGIARLRDALQDGERVTRVQWPRASRRRRPDRTHSRARGAVHCDDAAQGRIPAVDEDTPGLSPAPVRSGIRLCHRKPHRENRFASGYGAKNHFDSASHRPLDGHDSRGLDLDFCLVFDQRADLDERHRRKVLAHHAAVGFAQFA